MSVLAAAGGAIGAGAVALAWAGLVELRWFALRRAEVPVLRGPGRLRVLHLSDLHLLPWQDRKLEFVRRCAAHEPDVVVATGDLLGHPEAVRPAVDALNAVAADRLALVVLGSNDFFAPRLGNPMGYLRGPSGVHPRRARLDTQAMVEGLAEGGWRLMDNTQALLQAGSTRLDVAGLGDPHMRRDRPDAVDWPDEAARAASGPLLRLGLVHAPYLRALDVFAKRGYDLVLAGHTHGGQVRVPGVGALVTNCDLPRQQARGLSRHDGAWLHVSAGLGTSMYAPVRFACRPEATVLDLVPA